MTKELNLKDETTIIIAFYDCLNIFELILNFSFKKGTSYLFESLFIRLRHLSYYLSYESSPLFEYNNKLSEKELSTINKIINFRNASAHPESKENWFNNYIMIVGGMNFKKGDVEIQYGSNKLFLIKEIIPFYKKLREVLSQTSELSHLIKSYDWKNEEEKFKIIEQELKKMCKEKYNNI